MQVLAAIPSPPFQYLQVGPLRLHVYGLLIAVGILIAAAVVRRRYERYGGDPAIVEPVLLWAVGAGFLGARAAYVSTHLSRMDTWWEVFAIWEGGLAFFGGLTVGAVAAVVAVRRYEGDVLGFADAAAVGVPLAQAVGRWGNYFNQELFGTPSDLPWAVRIDPANRPEAYADAATFHPTFLYESLWNLTVVGILVGVERRWRPPRGSLILLYLALYGTGRFLLELMRTDTTFRFLGISRNGWVSLLAVVVAVSLLVARWRSSDPTEVDSRDGIDAGQRS